MANKPGLSPPYQAAMVTAIVNVMTGAKSPIMPETASRMRATAAVALIAIRYPRMDCWIGVRGSCRIIPSYQSTIGSAGDFSVSSAAGWA